MKKEALLLIDCQKDFGEKGGGLYVIDGEMIVPVINDMIDEIKNRAGLIIASRDWHPENHTSFSIWPKHCVKNTRGAEYMDGINIDLIEHEVRKGFRIDSDSYSAFGGFEFRGDFPLRDLDTLLEDYEIKILNIVGLATDYCVKETVLDGRRLGYEVRVINAGIKGVDIAKGDSDKAIAKMIQAGAIILR